MTLRFPQLRHGRFWHAAALGWRGGRPGASQSVAPASVGIPGIGDPGFTVEAMAVFAAFTTPPTDSRKKLIDACIVSLKAGGVWSALDVLYVLAAADSQAAQINWKNPGAFTAIEVNAPAFVADRGYTSDVSTSRLRTQYTPSANAINVLQDDASIWSWVVTNVATNQRSAGSLTGPATGLLPRALDNTMAATVNGSSSVVSSSITTLTSVGLSGATRASGTTIKLWLNGAQFGTDVSSNSTALASQEQWICAANATSFYSGQVGVAAWGASLAGLEAAFYSALLVYMQGVGAA